jgi:hypothetical protein
VPLTFDASLQPLVLERLGNEIHLPSQKLAKSALKTHQPNEPDARLRIQLSRKINIAVGPGLAARNRTEQCEVANASVAELSLMRSQNRDDGFGRECGARAHDQNSTRRLSLSNSDTAGYEPPRAALVARFP